MSVYKNVSVSDSLFSNIPNTEILEYFSSLYSLHFLFVKLCQNLMIHKLMWIHIYLIPVTPRVALGPPLSFWLVFIYLLIHLFSFCFKTEFQIVQVGFELPI